MSTKRTIQWYLSISCIIICICIARMTPDNKELGVYTLEFLRCLMFALVVLLHIVLIVLAGDLKEKNETEKGEAE